MRVAGVKGRLQLRQKQPPKESREHAHRQEETRAAGHPALAIGTQATAWDYAVQMRMVQQILAPGMQNGDETDLGAQVLGIGRNRAQGLSRGVKQEVIDYGLVLVRDRRDGLGQRKDDVEIRHGKEVGLAII